MSVQKIIQESLGKNPLAMKEALEEELRSRIAAALESKIAESKDENELDEEVEQIDEISAKKLDDYRSKRHDAYKKIQQRGGGPNNTPVYSDKEKRRYADHPYKDNPGNTAFKKLTGRARVNATEEFDLSDLTLEELEDFMESSEFDQLDEISKDLARRYIKGAKTDMAIAQKYHRVGAGGPENTKLYQKRKAGVDKATSRLTK
jgi:hypothetical protein